MKTLQNLSLLLVLSSMLSCQKTQEPLSTTTNTNDDRPAATEATVITVARDGTGNYTTVQAALNAVANNSAHAPSSI